MTLAMLAAAALPLALAACGTETTATTQTPVGDNADSGNADSADSAASDAELVVGEWIPRSLTLDGQTYTLPQTERTADAQVVIDPGHTEGGGGRSGLNVGCNSAGTDISIEGDTLHATEFVSTLMACGEELGRFEQGAIEIFESDPAFELSDSGDALTLTSANGDTLELVRGEGEGDEAAPIVGVRWLVEGYTVGLEQTIFQFPEEGRRAYLEIDPPTTPEGGSDTVFDSGCNQFHGTVEVGEDSLTVIDGSTTEIGCPDHAGDTEEAIFGVFHANPAYEVSDSGDRLTLTAGNGDNVTFTRE
ncbi:META domain-containing protein [Streptomyces sp. 6N223]|uniref:META domain-containing protein n=1 Tax=Streptomyces sp. 6N223 TaxID=3457412 RepID=UPI003FD6025F